MIWLWFPGFDEDRNIAAPPVDLTDLTNDQDIPITAVRTHVVLRNPDYSNDIKKPYNMSIRRSMNDRVRTYITRDRAQLSAFTLSLSFRNLHEERRNALEHFILSSDGQYVGYKDPVDRMHVGHILDSDMNLQSDGRDAGRDEDGNWKESYVTITTLTLQILRHEGHEL